MEKIWIKTKSEICKRLFLGKSFLLNKSETAELESEGLFHARVRVWGSEKAI